MACNFAIKNLHIAKFQEPEIWVPTSEAIVISSISWLNKASMSAYTLAYASSRNQHEKSW